MISENQANRLLLQAKSAWKSQKAERPTDEEPLSVCCSAPFTYPGWPDSDFCSECHEHASTWEDEDG